jgi:hypothetical protein
VVNEMHVGYLLEELASKMEPIRQMKYDRQLGEIKAYLYYDCHAIYIKMK